MSDPIQDEIDRLISGDRDQRDSAAFVLRSLVFDLDRLVPVLEHPHVSRQVKAIEVLRAFRTLEAAALLVPMLASQIPIVAQKASSSLGIMLPKLGHASPAAIELVRAALPSATTPSHRLAILDVLSRLADPLGRETLLVEADAWDAEHRKHAIDYLRRYRDEPPVETIVGALADPDARIQAIDVAGRLQHDAFVRPLVAICLEDKPPEKAVSALMKFSMRAVHAVLEHAHEQALHRRVESVLDYLFHRPEVVDSIWTIWEHSETPVRNACLKALAHHARRLSRSQTRAALLEHISDPNPTRRIWCAQGLDKLRDVRDSDGTAALLALERLAVDPDENVRSHAGAALRRRV